MAPKGKGKAVADNGSSPPKGGSSTPPPKSAWAGPPESSKPSKSSSVAPESSKSSSAGPETSKKYTPPPPPAIAVRGSCCSSTATRSSDAPAKTSAEPSSAGPGVVFLYPPTSLPALVVSSWFVPTVKRPFKGIPTFVMSVVIQSLFIGYLAYTVIDRWGEMATCNSAALCQVVAVYVFITALFCTHSSGTVLQICLYSTTLRVDAVPSPDDMGIMRLPKEVVAKSLEGIPIRPTTRRQRLQLALVPLVDMALELAIFVAGTLFLVTADNTSELIVNTVAVTFIQEVDELLLKSFFSKASIQRLAKYRLDHRWGVADGDTRLVGQSPAMQRYNRFLNRAPLLLLLLTLTAVAAAQVYGRLRESGLLGEDNASCEAFFV